MQERETKICESGSKHDEIPVARDDSKERGREREGGGGGRGEEEERREKELEQSFAWKKEKERHVCQEKAKPSQPFLRKGVTVSISRDILLIHPQLTFTPRNI